MPTSPTGRPRGRAAGFTLVELVVVVVVIAVLSGMALISMAGSAGNAAIRSGARQFYLAAASARAQAALRATPHRLVIDPREGRFLVERESAEEPGRFEAVTEGGIRPASLPEGVGFGYLDVEGAELNGPVVTFEPGGAATAAVIEVTDGRRSFTLRVDGGTGYVELTEGLEQERLSERVDLDA